MSRPRLDDAGRSSGGRTASGTHVLADCPALLAEAGCRTLSELDRLVTDSFELDPHVLECTAEHVLIVIRDRGVALAFPFAVEELWEAVRELERDVTQRIEDAARPED